VYIYPEKTQYTSSSPLACFSCRKPLSSEDKFCPGCGKAISRCKICRGAIAYGDTPSQCPHCQNEFHQEHIREWLKVSADCPVCRVAIKERELVAVVQSS
jgi:predicted amidophosphoribosyltransferase